MVGTPYPLVGGVSRVGEWRRRGGGARSSQDGKQRRRQGGGQEERGRVVGQALGIDAGVFNYPR